MFRKFFKFLICVIGVLGLLFGAFCVWVSDRASVPILMYHNVDSSSEEKLNMVSPENFAKQMAYLKQHRYNVIPLSAFVQSLKDHTPLPKKSVVITFDDGYEDNYSKAFPILKENNFSATIFVVTDMVGKKGFVTWDQIREMEKSNISFGSHTRLHTYLPSLDAAEQRNQIQISKEIMEAELGHKVDYFAYPSGGFNRVSLNLVKEAGYLGACTTNRGYNKLNDDPFMIRRIRLGNKDDTDLELWAKFSGYYQVFRRVRNPD